MPIIDNDENGNPIVDTSWRLGNDDDEIIDDGEDDTVCHTWHPCDVETNLYEVGWENFGQAWSIWTNPDATTFQRAGAGYYMGTWGGAHTLGAIGIAGVVCGLTPACAGVVEGFLGIGGAAQTANMACGGDMCASETQDIVTVIGRYPANRKLAESIGGNWLNIPARIWNSMNPAEQWERNKQWLQEAIIRGDTFRLASKISKAVPDSGFALELEYLIHKAGYTISLNGQYLYPPGP